MKQSPIARHIHRLLHKLLIVITLCGTLFLTTSAVNAKSTPTIELSQSAQQVWQRQQVLITLVVKSDDPFARLEVEPFKQKGFSIVSFDLQRLESDKQTLLRLQWAVFPFIAGKQTLKLPRVRYRPNRGRIQTLDLKKVNLNVRRLPVYISPTMPVGKISLKSHWQEGWFVPTDNLLEWQITVKGEHVAQQFMPPLSRQLSSTDAVEILPPQKSDKPLKTITGISHVRHYTIPLKISHNGFVSLPEVEVQYFEPVSGKLEKVHLSPPSFIAVNNWLLGFMILLFVVLISILLFILSTKLKNIFQSKQKQRQAIQQLSQATNYQQIRAALNQYSLAKGWGDNISLKKLASLQAQGGDKNALEKTIDKLQSQQFSQKKGDVEIVKIRNNLLRHLKASESAP